MTDGCAMIAMPCGCGFGTCEGWAMLSGATIINHMRLYAPEKLRDAYMQAVVDSGGE